MLSSWSLLVAACLESKSVRWVIGSGILKNSAQGRWAGTEGQTRGQRPRTMGSQGPDHGAGPWCWGQWAWSYFLVGGILWGTPGGPHLASPRNLPLRELVDI